MSSKKFLCLFFSLLLVFPFVSCSVAGGDGEGRENDKKVVYEAFFLDNDEILSRFAEVRGETAPYERVTKDFHVTTSYMPETDCRSLYGREVTIRVTLYQCGVVLDDNGQPTSNEGFFGSVSSEDAELMAMIDSIDKNWHITGSYQGAAKYTEYLDLTDAKEVDFTVKGVFGAFLGDGVYTFSPDLSPEKEAA